MDSVKTQKHLFLLEIHQSNKHDKTPAVLLAFILSTEARKCHSQTNSKLQVPGVSNPHNIGVFNLSKQDHLTLTKKDV